MIVFCREGRRAAVHVISRRQPRLNMLGFEGRVLFESGKCYLKLPDELIYLHKEPVQDGCCLKIGKTGNDRQQCILNIMMQDDDYGCFLNYGLPDHRFRIGSSEDCEICIGDADLPDTVCTVDPATKTVAAAGGVAAALNGIILDGTAGYAEGDILLAMNLRMVLFQESTVVNQCRNVKIHLPRREPVCYSDKLECPICLIAQQFRHVRIPKALIIDLEEPLAEENRTSMPLILTMGPAVTMSSAAMVAGLISVYDGYQAGKEVRQLLPMILLPGVMLISSSLWSPIQRWYETKRLQQAANIRKTAYLLYLESVRQDIIEYRNKLQQTLLNSLPPPDLLLARLDKECGLWQKTAADDDWLLIRLGTGEYHHQIVLKQMFRLRRSDPLYMAVQNLKRKYAEQSGMPVYADLKKYKRIEICCQEQQDDSYLEYLFLQLATSFNPGEVQLMLFCEPIWLNRYSWLRYHPIFLSPAGIRMIANSVEDAQFLLRDLNDDSRQIIILVQAELMDQLGESRKNVCWIYLSSNGRIRRSHLDLIVSVKGHEGQLIEPSRRKEKFRIQSIDRTAVQFWNKRIQYFRSQTINYDESVNYVPFCRMYQQEQIPANLILENWNQNHTYNGVCGYLGMNDAGHRITLDLHERGKGPHGLLAGTTGSGKSELIISFLLSLCVNYSPRELQIVLIDFKGGGSVQAFENSDYVFPHIAGTITDLDMNEMERALVSFSIECKKREMLLKRMADASRKSVMNIDSYQKSWKEEYQLPYLSHLLIVVDEFAELRKSRPEFMTDLISIARIGRSLGIHLLLSTQKAAGIVDDQIWANCSYKICMRVQDRQDSLEMIKTPDAAVFRNPGRFCLLADGNHEFGQSAFANASVENAAAKAVLLDQMLRPLKERTAERQNQETQLTILAKMIVQEARNIGCNSRWIWKPPLPEQNWQEVPDSCIVLGRIDDYYHNEQPLFIIDKKHSRTACIYSLDMDEKMEFLKTLLYSILRKAKRSDEIFIIDDTGIPYQWIQSIPQVIDVFPSTDLERLENLQKHIEMRLRKSENECYLIATHLPSLMESEEFEGKFLRRMIEKSGTFDLHLFLFTTTAASIHYRDAQLMQTRICLRNENLQDVMSIFECTTKKTQCKKGYGLMKSGNLLEFRYIRTSEEELLALSQRISLRYGTRKTYRLPAMPEHLHLPDDSSWNGREENRIGMDIANYQWVEMPAESLIVIAEYLDELNCFREFCRKKLFYLYRCFSPDEAAEAMTREEHIILFMTCAEYQQKGLKTSGVPHAILFIGSGYDNQYVFQCSYRRPLKPNQGILFSRTRNQVIQIAEL